MTGLADIDGFKLFIQMCARAGIKLNPRPASAAHVYLNNTTYENIH